MGRGKKGREGGGGGESAGWGWGRTKGGGALGRRLSLSLSPGAGRAGGRGLAGQSPADARGQRAHSTHTHNDTAASQHTHTARRSGTTAGGRRARARAAPPGKARDRPPGHARAALPPLSLHTAATQTDTHTHTPRGVSPAARSLSPRPINQQSVEGAAGLGACVCACVWSGRRARPAQPTERRAQRVRLPGWGGAEREEGRAHPRKTKCVGPRRLAPHPHACRPRHSAPVDACVCVSCVVVCRRHRGRTPGRREGRARRGRRKKPASSSFLSRPTCGGARVAAFQPVLLYPLYPPKPTLN